MFGIHEIDHVIYKIWMLLSQITQIIYIRRTCKSDKASTRSSILYKLRTKRNPPKP